MENTNITNARPASKLSVILLGLTVFLLLLNLATYGCSWYGRKPMTAEGIGTVEKENYSEQKRPWNTAVFYLLGTSTLVTFVQMIIIMWQAWGMHKTSKAKNIKKTELDETNTYV